MGSPLWQPREIYPAEFMAAVSVLTAAEPSVRVQGSRTLASVLQTLVLPAAELPAQLALRSEHHWNRLAFAQALLKQAQLKRIHRKSTCLQQLQAIALRVQPSEATAITSETVAISCRPCGTTASGKRSETARAATP